MPALTKQEITACFKAARRVLKHPGLDILIAATPSIGKLLVVTPGRVGNAAERNLIRRRLKAIFYEEKLGNRGYDCIVLVKKMGIALSFDELKALLTHAIPDKEPIPTP